MTDIINPLGLLLLPVLLLPNVILLLFKNRRRHSKANKFMSSVRLISGIACLALLLINTKGEDLSFETVGNFARFVSLCTGFCIAYLVTWVLYYIRQNIYTNILMTLAVLGIYATFIFTFGLWELAIPLILFIISHVFIIVETHQELLKHKRAKLNKEQKITETINED
ncbi:MAG: hypothetical protein R3Y23_05140 [Bacillota bacterium]